MKTSVEIMAKAYDEATFEPRSTMTRIEEVSIRMRAVLRALAARPLPEAATEAAFWAASSDDRWCIEDEGHFQKAHQAAMLALAAEGEK